LSSARAGLPAAPPQADGEGPLNVLTHLARRTAGFRAVDLWPLVQSPPKLEIDPWKPVDAEPEKSANKILAQQIAHDIKAQVQFGRTKAGLAANQELLTHYWHIGRLISSIQRTENYGTQMVEKLASDIQRELPGLGGFSPLNVWRMRAFYLAHRERRGESVTAGDRFRGAPGRTGAGLRLRFPGKNVHTRVDIIVHREWSIASRGVDARVYRSRGTDPDSLEFMKLNG
jgi:hypothetical protein